MTDDVMNSGIDSVAREFDPYDPDQVTHMHQALAAFRSKCPVPHSEQQKGFWLATRYDDIRQAALDHATFSSRSVMVPRDRLGPELEERPPITLDPPRHTSFRRLLLPGFAPAQVARLEPSIRATCRTAIAAIAESAECDVVNDYAKKIPVELICTMLGVPVSIAPTFANWVHDLVEAEEMDKAAAAGAAMAGWIAGEIEKHASEPQDDLITLLMTSEVDGQRLSPEELVGALLLILIGGMDTTWSVIGSMLWHLAQHPDDRARLVAEPSLIPTAVEEFLRVYSPISLARITTTEADLGGTVIPADEVVLLSFPSGNRDETAFPDPDCVQLDRKPNRHVAFGVGQHRCIGSNIARLELQVGLEEWMSAFPDFELVAPEAVTWATGQVWGPRSAIVRFPHSKSVSRS